jgi:hypothetical protein
MLKMTPNFVKFLIPIFSKAKSAEGGLGAIRATNGQTADLNQIGIATAYNMEGTSLPQIERNGSEYTFRHSGLIGAVSVTSSTVRGDVLNRVRVDPTLETWLNRMMNFEFYQFTHVVISYRPMCSTTQAGGIVMFFEFDPDDLVVGNNGEGSVKDAMAHFSAVLTNVWNPAHSYYNVTDHLNVHKVYYTGTEHRDLVLEVQAVFTVLAASDFGADLDVGELWVTYECVVAVPEVRSELHGDWASRNGGAAKTAAIPFGSSVALDKLYFTDPVLGELQIAQTMWPLYFYEASTPSYLIQLPAGPYAFFWRIVGTNISAAATTVIGNYDIIHSSTPIDANFSNFSATQAVGFCLVMSSGQDKGRQTTDIPTSGIRVTLTADTVTGSAFRVTCLSGAYRMSYSNIEMLDALETFGVTERRLKEKVDDLEQKMDKFTRIRQTPIRSGTDFALKEKETMLLTCKELNERLELLKEQMSSDEFTDEILI